MKIDGVNFPCDMLVLSDENKRSMYDAGLYDPFEEEGEVRKNIIIYFLEVIPTRCRIYVLEIQKQRRRFFQYLVNRLH